MPVALRLYKTTDLEALTSIYAHYVTKTFVTFDEVPPTLAEMRVKVDAIVAFYPMLVCEDSEKV
jgi:L-amino acid N-acyltransferase YncA